MFTRLKCIAVYGIDAISIDVEVNISDKGFPGFSIVGIPQKQAEECKERVKTALINSGEDFPMAKITVNLSPAELVKDGTVFDLPISVGILQNTGVIKLNSNKSIFFGQLSLDGQTQNSRGVFSLALFAKENKVQEIYVPRVNANEAAVIKEVNTFPVESLGELIKHLNGEKFIAPLKNIDFLNYPKSIPEFDFSEIMGQEQAKRAMEIACAGGHNIILSGLPGAGKTMIARASPGILPDMTEEEAVELTRIYSVTGNIPEGGSLIRQRPFRSPHHTISSVSLVGGGSNPRPGEVSLAHRGVLFLDEMPEMNRSCIEALRQPLEDGYVNVSRIQGSFRFPAKFMLIAAVNPCPCGYFRSQVKECVCSKLQIDNYNKKLSGPIMDRIDMNVRVENVDINKIIKNTSNLSETSECIKARVDTARQRQLKRYLGSGIFSNSELRNRQIKNLLKIDNEAERFLSEAITDMQLSARTYFKLIKISQTIADLEGSETIGLNHVAEAIQYKFNDDR